MLPDVLRVALGSGLILAGVLGAAFWILVFAGSWSRAALGAVPIALGVAILMWG